MMTVIVGGYHMKNAKKYFLNIIKITLAAVLTSVSRILCNL